MASVAEQVGDELALPSAWYDDISKTVRRMRLCTKGEDVCGSVSVLVWVLLAMFLLFYDPETVAPSLPLGTVVVSAVAFWANRRLGKQRWATKAVLWDRYGLKVTFDAVGVFNARAGRVQWTNRFDLVDQKTGEFLKSWNGVLPPFQDISEAEWLRRRDSLGNG